MADDVIVYADLSKPDAWAEAQRKRQEELIKSGQKPDLPDYAPGGSQNRFWYQDENKVALAGVAGVFLLIWLFGKK